MIEHLIFSTGFAIYQKKVDEDNKATCLHHLLKGQQSERKTHMVVWQTLKFKRFKSTTGRLSSTDPMESQCHAHSLNYSKSELRQQ